MFRIVTYFYRIKHTEAEESCSEKSINASIFLTKSRWQTRTIFWILLLAFPIFSPLVGTGQTQTVVEGVVADSATFKPMPYVNIAVKNKASGTQSDSNGEFKLFASSTDTLTFSFVGYTSAEVPVNEWISGGVLLLVEKSILLKSITILGSRSESFYENIFREENERWQRQNKKLPFYMSKEKKETKKLLRLDNENERVRTYMEVIVMNGELKKTLMKKHNIDDKKYYELIAKFNEENHRIMYYLTASELLSLMYRFFDANTSP